LPGIFAVGDVRGGSIKRVASAVGEGSIAISFVHKVLQEYEMHGRNNGYTKRNIEYRTKYRRQKRNIQA